MIKHLRSEYFEPEHVRGLDLRPEDTYRPSRADAQSLVDKGIARSVFDGDKIVFCGGVVILHPGVAEGWLLCCKGVERYKKEVYVYTVAFLEFVGASRELHRIQAHVRAGWATAQRFLEHLGFFKEGLLRQFGPDRDDYYIYARIG